MRVLNVGGGSRYLPPMFDGWIQDLLDIDKDLEPDLCMNAKDIRNEVVSETYDAVYCSHNLEHVYQHEVPLVLEGFHHALKPKGFAYVLVPDVAALMQSMVGKDIDEMWYMAGEDRISFHDVLYGWGKMIAKGNEYYAHKTGFTPQSLDRAMKQFFPIVHIARDGFNLSALAIKVGS